MKDLISRGIGYYIVFPSQGPPIFWLSLQKIVEATLWAWTGLKKRAWNRREGGRAQLLKKWHNPRAYRKPIKIKWIKDDKSNSTKPWSSVCKLNDTPRGARTVPRHCQKTEEWVVPQLLEWPSHSLAYEITQPSKTNHTTFHGRHTLLCDGPHSWSVLLSKSEQQIYLLPITVSLTEFIYFFCNETSRAWASLGPKTRHHGFWRASSPSWIWLSG